MPRIITKADTSFPKNLDFGYKKFPVKIRDIQKIDKKTSIRISVFCYENKEKYPIYLWSNLCWFIIDGRRR